MKNLILLAVIVGVCGYFGSKFYLHYRLSSGLDNALVMAAPFAQIQYDGVSSSITGDLSIDGISIRMNDFGDPLYIDKLSLITPGYFFLLNMANMGQPGQDFKVPDTFGFAVDGVRTSTSSDYVRKIYELGREKVKADDAETVAAVCAGKYGFSPGTLEQLGYKDLVVSMRMAYRQDEQNLFLDVSADIVDMYQVNMTVKLADRLTPETLLRGNYRPRMSEGRIEYLDLSLNERTAELCARQGLSDSEILVAQVDAFAASGLESGLEFDDYVIEPYKEFLSGKSTFVLTARPNKPVSLTQIGLYKPSDVPALLNLEGEVY